MEVFLLFQLSDYLDGVNVETSSGLSVTVTSKKSSHSWIFSLLCKVGWSVQCCSQHVHIVFPVTLGQSALIVLTICSDCPSPCLLNQPARKLYRIALLYDAHRPHFFITGVSAGEQLQAVAAGCQEWTPGEETAGVCWVYRVCCHCQGAVVRSEQE